MLRESQFKNDAKSFIATELDALPNSNYIKKNATYTYSPNEKSVIELTTFGADEIPQSTQDLLKQRLSAYKALNGVELYVNQAKKDDVNNLEYMEELRYRDSLELMSQQQKIVFLEDRVRKLARLERDQIPFDELIKELKINYEKLAHISFSNEIRSNLTAIDTMKVFNVRWIDSLVTDESKVQEQNKLSAFLKERLDLDTLIVREIRD